MVVYIVKCRVSGKVYIGKTTRRLSTRWACHKYDAVNCANQTHIARAIRKYGPSAFEISVLCRVSSEAALSDAEILFIKLFNACDPSVGYNRAEGGLGGSRQQYWSPQQRRAMSVKLIARDVRQFKPMCPNGHDYDETNTYWKLGRRGLRYRICRECRKIGMRAQRMRASPLG